MDAPGYKFRCFADGVQAFPLIAEGGLLSSGLVVDASSAPAPECHSVQVLLRDEIQHMEGTRVRFGCRVFGEATVSMRSMEVLADGAVVRFHTTDHVFALLGEGDHDLALGVALHPAMRALTGSEDLYYGPEVCVPSGSRVELRNFQVTPWDRPPRKNLGEDAKPFVDWFQQRRGFPRPLDQWQTQGRLGRGWSFLRPRETTLDWRLVGQHLVVHSIQGGHQLKAFAWVGPGSMTPGGSVNVQWRVQAPKGCSLRGAEVRLHLTKLGLVTSPSPWMHTIHGVAQPCTTRHGWADLKVVATIPEGLEDVDLLHLAFDFPSGGRFLFEPPRIHGAWR